MAALSLRHHIQLGIQYRQDRQQLARAEFGRPAPLKTGQGFGRDARLRRHILLFQTEQFATGGDDFAKLLKGLQLIYMSSFNMNPSIIDLKINFYKPPRFTESATAASRPCG